MMLKDCVLSGSLLVVFSLFCYAVCFLEQINSLSLSLSRSLSDHYSHRKKIPPNFLLLYTCCCAIPP